MPGMVSATPMGAAMAPAVHRPSAAVLPTTRRYERDAGEDPQPAECRHHDSPRQLAEPLAVRLHFERPRALAPKARNADLVGGLQERRVLLAEHHPLPLPKELGAGRLTHRSVVPHDLPDDLRILGEEAHLHLSRRRLLAEGRGQRRQKHLNRRPAFRVRRGVRRLLAELGAPGLAHQRFAALGARGALPDGRHARSTAGGDRTARPELERAYRERSHDMRRARACPMSGHPRGVEAGQVELPRDRRPHRQPSRRSQLALEGRRSQRQLRVELVLVLDFDGVGGHRGALPRVAARHAAGVEQPHLAPRVSHHHASLSETRLEVRLLRGGPLGHEGVRRARRHLALRELRRRLGRAGPRHERPAAPP